MEIVLGHKNYDNSKLYKMKLIFFYLRYISDSTILLSKNQVSLRILSPIDEQFQSFSYSDLHMVQLHRKGSVLKGIIIGGISGAAAGCLFGLVKYGAETKIVIDPWDGTSKTVHPAQSPVLGATLAGTVTGAILGGAIGAIARKVFVINGKKARFAKFRHDMLAKIIYQ